MKLAGKQNTPGFRTTLCNWMLVVLWSRPQRIWKGSYTSSTLVLNTGAPQRGVLSPLLLGLEQVSTCKVPIGFLKDYY